MQNSGLTQQNQNLTQQNVFLNQQLAATSAALDAALNQPVPSSAQRPRTSDSLQQRRFDVQATLDAEFADLDEGSATIEAIWDLDPAWILLRLRADRQAAAENEESKWKNLGCWMRARDSNHPYGYTKVNLRNTYHPSREPRVHIGCQPFRHQLGVVAAGLGQNLLRTTGADATDDVSHLCHNHRCFNPDHLVVESKGMNQRRGVCVGQYMVKIRSDGTIYNPCTHDREEHYVACILPRVEFNVAGGYYQNSPQGPQQRI